MAKKLELTAYDKLLLARSPKRRGIEDYIEELFDFFIELHGDRLYGDDPSIIGGIARFHGRPVTVIGHKKGKNTEEKIRCRFGMTSPEGYRKARRLMGQAEKFNRPVITFVDTPGAYPGLEAESNGQSNAIAENLALMSRLKVPIVTIITGEGNSGGALAIAVANSVWMLENSVYSILSPEGFASIMYKDPKLAPEACDIMKITADDLKDFGIIDGIIPEGKKCIKAIDSMLINELERLGQCSPIVLAEERYMKFRKIDANYIRA